MLGVHAAWALLTSKNGDNNHNNHYGDEAAC